MFSIWKSGFQSRPRRIEDRFYIPFPEKAAPCCFPSATQRSDDFVGIARPTYPFSASPVWLSARLQAVRGQAAPRSAILAILSSSVVPFPKNGIESAYNRRFEKPLCTKRIHPIRWRVFPRKQPFYNFHTFVVWDSRVCMVANVPAPYSMSQGLSA